MNGIEVLTLIPDIVDFLLFLLHLVIFYIPCTIGTITAYLVKKELYKSNPEKRKKIRNKKFSVSFVTSIIPAVILTMVNNSTLFEHTMQPYKYGIAILMGVIGEDISAYSLTLKNLSIAFCALTKGVDGVKELTERMTKDSENEDEKK